MNSDLRSYETFYWVARLGSFSRAAERLHTTQPAVSQRVAGLEFNLGAALLERTGRRIRATPKGQELCEHIERLLHLIEEMKRAVSSSAGRRSHVRLGVDETLAHIWLPAFIERVHKIHPQHRAGHPDRHLAAARGCAGGRADRPRVHDRGCSSAASAVSFSLCRYPLAFVASPGLEIEADADGRVREDRTRSSASRSSPIRAQPFPTSR